MFARIQGGDCMLGMKRTGSADADRIHIFTLENLL